MNDSVSNEIKEDNELKVLMAECERLHLDRRNWDNNIFKLFVLLLTISAVSLAAVIQVQTNTENQNNYWEFLVIAYPYILYVFTLIFLILSGAIFHNSASLLIIENKINRIVGKLTLTWEEAFVEGSFFKFGSTYFFATILLVLALITFSVYFITLSLRILEGSETYEGYIILNVISIIFIVSLILYHLIFEKKIILLRLKRYYDEYSD